MTFLKNFFSNFRSHIKDSKWGRKCNSINCTSSNRSPQVIPFQLANGKLPHFCCRAFWAQFLFMKEAVYHHPALFFFSHLYYPKNEEFTKNFRLREYLVAFFAADKQYIITIQSLVMDF